jgi:hypothetical protein
MRYIDVDDDYVGQILAANKMAKGSLNEGEMPDFIKDKMKKKGEKDEKDEKKSSCESNELHACPLCESELDQPLTSEQLQEHVAFILDKLNEAEEFEGEDLDEQEEDEDGEEEDEEA